MGLDGADLSHSFSVVSPKSGFIPGMALEPSISMGALNWEGMTLPERTGEGREEVCGRPGGWGTAPSPTERLRPT